MFSLCESQLAAIIALQQRTVLRSFIRANLEAQGTPIGPMDTLIVTTARLLTHFAA